MAALALFFQKMGVSISGSDIPDVFYTDELLRTAGISWNEHFSAAHIPDKTEMVVYSAAYSKESNEELAFACKNYPCYSYPHMLGWVSAQQESWAVIGTHGKTSTAALMGALCRSQNYPVMGLTGAKVADFGDSTFFVDGKDVFLAEVCEYRGHFMNFFPTHIVFLNAEWDHTDYFPNTEAVYAEFAEFILKLPANGKLIACVSDVGVQKTLDIVLKKRSDICIVPYRVDEVLDHTAYNGKEVQVLHDYQRIQEQGSKLQSCRIKNFTFSESTDASVWKLRNPAKPLLWNMVAALIFIKELKEQFGNGNLQALQECLLNFGSLSRRSELLFQNDDITIVDDYAHHPHAIQATLQSLLEHYQPKRCIVDFMSHTYTRTQSLWDSFAHCFRGADVLIINKIYSSAREEEEFQEKQNALAGADAGNTGNAANAANTGNAGNACNTGNAGTKQFPSGEGLAQHIGEQQANVLHIASFEASADYIYSILQKGDLVITMGAGDNFRVAEHLISRIKKEQV